MDDAQARLAERLVVDLEQILGPAIRIDGISIEGDTPVVVRVVCLVDGRSSEIEAHGETAIDAISDVMRVAAETRLTVAFGQLIAPA